MKGHESEGSESNGDSPDLLDTLRHEHGVEFFIGMECMTKPCRLALEKSEPLKTVAHLPSDRPEKGETKRVQNLIQAPAIGHSDNKMRAGFRHSNHFAQGLGRGIHPGYDSNG